MVGPGWLRRCRGGAREGWGMKRKRRIREHYTLCETLEILDAVLSSRWSLSEGALRLSWGLPRLNPALLLSLIYIYPITTISHFVYEAYILLFASRNLTT